MSSREEQHALADDDDKNHGALSVSHHYTSYLTFQPNYEKCKANSQVSDASRDGIPAKHTRAYEPATSTVLAVPIANIQINTMSRVVDEIPNNRQRTTIHSDVSTPCEGSSLVYYY